MIALPPNQRFSLTNVSWILDTRKDVRDEKNIFLGIFLFAKGLSKDDIGVARGTVSQKIRPVS